MQSLFLVAVVVAVLVAVLAPQPGAALPVDRSKRAEADCRPPANMADLFRSLNAHVNASMLLRPTELTEPSRLLPNELNNGDTVLGLLYGGSECPKDLETSPGAPLMARSSCPWFLDLEELSPSSRFFPSILPQARCRCSKCLRQSDLACEAVTTHVRILEYTGCHNGFKTYTTVTRPISVGCTCAAAPVTVVGGVNSSRPVYHELAH